MLSLHNALAHERMREFERQAAHQRLANRLHAESRWMRLSQAAERRQRRASRRVAEAREAYALAG